MKTRFTLSLLTFALAVPIASAQDFAVEPLGFTTIGDASSDGTFAINGAFITADATLMSGGGFALSGKFQAITAAPPLPPPAGNLLPHGDAEGLQGGNGYGNATMPGWSLAGNFQVVRWDAGNGFPSLDSPGPKDRGENFFSGGDESELATATIRIEIPASPDRIDAGLVRAEISGWFGGFQGQDDAAWLKAAFLDAAGAELESFKIGGFSAENRMGRTGLFPDSAARVVPMNARQVEAGIEIKRSANAGYNDGYADSLSLILTAVDSTPNNLPPAADAGAPQTIAVQGGERILLDGGKSADPEGAALTYAWRQLSGPALTLTNEATAQPSFLAPAVLTPATFTFELIVNDGARTSEADTTEVTLIPSGAAPPELAVNGGFEDTEGTFLRDGSGLMSLPAGAKTVPGWTTTLAELAWVDNANTFGAATPFGSHFLELTGYHDHFPYGGVTQAIATTPGQTYRLSFALGSNADYPGAGLPKSVFVCAGSTGAVFTFFPANASGNVWETFTHHFTADSPSTVIAIEGGRQAGNYIGLDNVSVIADTPPHSPAPPNLVVNGSFETFPCSDGFAPDGSGVMPLPPGSTSVWGWTTTAAELAWAMNGNAFGPRTSHGSLFLDLTGYHDAPPYGGITQTLATAPNERYRLSFSIGSDQDRTLYRGPMTVEVRVGSVSQSFTFAPSGGGVQWGRFTLDFTADAPATALAFQGTMSGGGAYLGLDDISVVRISEAPRAAILSVSLNELRARFPVEPGRTYTAQSREDLAAGEWLDVPNTTLTSSGESLELSLPFSASQPQRYYRIRQLP